MLQRLKELTLKSRFNAVSRMVHQAGNYRRWKDEEPYGHVRGTLKSKVVQMELNRGHKDNLLTPMMIKEIQRFLKSYEIDDTIDLLWCQSSHPEVFSRGTDLKCNQLNLIQKIQDLFQKVMEKKEEDALFYLQEVQNCAKAFATFQKPHLTYLQGEISGSAAAIIGQVPFGIVEDNVRWWMNEPMFGFVPHGGASYILSRLPGELGVFLAMTGISLNHKDLVTLGLARYGLQTSLEEMRIDLSTLMYESGRSRTTDQSYGNMFQEFRTRRQAGHKEYISSVTAEIKDRLFNPDIDLAEDPRLVMSEILFRNEQVKQANFKFHLDNERERKTTQNISNHMANFEDKVFDHLRLNGHLSVPEVVTLSIHNEAISRCFSANTVEEIIQRLEFENSDWAKSILKKLSLRSPLSLKLTLKLIREAEQNTWVRCLENEYCVMSKLISHPDFKVGVNRLFQDSIKEKWQLDSLQKISGSEVQSYFETENKLKHGLVENAFHPVKDFYVNYPDNVRLFLNEETKYGDLKEREAQSVDVLAFLRNKNIAYEDATLENASIRRILMNFEEKKRILQMKVSKLFDICGSSQTLKIFYQIRRNYVEEQFKAEDIKEKIEKTIVDLFDYRYNERMEAYNHIAQTKLFKDKSDMFSSIRNTILNTRLFEEEGQKMKNIDNYKSPTERMLFFPEDDKVSFLETYNKSLEDTTLFKNLYAKYTNKKYRGIKGGTQKDYWRFKLMNQEPERCDTKLKEYDILYGDPLQEFDLSEYHNKLLEAGQRSEKIKQYIKQAGNEKVTQILKENIKVSERDMLENVIPLTKEQHQNAIIAQQIQISNLKEQIEEGKTIKNKNEILIKKLNKEQDSLKVNFNVQTIKDRFFRFIDSEKELQALLDPVLSSTDIKITQALQRKYQSLLTQIYTNKFKHFLKNNQLIQFNDDNSISMIDNFISMEVEKDLNKLLESHVFFTFSYLLLKDLEVFYQAFYEIAHTVPRQAEDYLRTMLIQVKERLGIEVQNPVQFNELLRYLNKLLEVGATLYDIYHDNLHFSSDKALSTLIQLREKQLSESYQVSEDFFTIATQSLAKKGANSPMWSKSTLMHYIENEEAGENDVMAYSQKWQLDRELKEKPDALKYHTGIYEKRAWKLMRLLKPLQLKEFVPGFEHYLMRIDLNVAKVQRTDQQITPQYIQQVLDAIDECEEARSITQNQPIDDWFKEKLFMCVKELFNVRRPYELKLSRDELRCYDLEFSRLFEPENLKAAFLRSLDRDMDQLGQFSTIVDQAKRRSTDYIFQELRPKLQKESPKNLPLSMTIMEVSPSPPPTQLYELEVELPPHPLKRGRKNLRSLDAPSQSEISVRFQKLKKDMFTSLKPILQSMGQDDHLSLNIHKELDEINQYYRDQ